MMHLILEFANHQESIRAVILNGSRASSSAQVDGFSDYDVICLVKDVAPFVEDNTWIKHFGELLIMQTPDSMDGGWPEIKDKYAFLMLFTDTNRIDLTCMTAKKYHETPRDSQSVLLLDKDKILAEFPPSSDKNYLPKPPIEKEFNDCCNEFYWVSTYVAKGIARNQLLYAKHMSEHIVKEQLIKMMVWQASIQTQFSKTMGSHYKYLREYTQPEIWDKLKNTYVGCDNESMWESLFMMCHMFDKLALEVSSHFSFDYSQDDYQGVVAYLRYVKG